MQRSGTRLSTYLISSPYNSGAMVMMVQRSRLRGSKFIQMHPCHVQRLLTSHEHSWSCTSWASFHSSTFHDWARAQKGLPSFIKVGKARWWGH